MPGRLRSPGVGRLAAVRRRAKGGLQTTVQPGPGPDLQAPIRDVAGAAVRAHDIVGHAGGRRPTTGARLPDGISGSLFGAAADGAGAGAADDRHRPQSAAATYVRPAAIRRADASSDRRAHRVRERGVDVDAVVRAGVAKLGRVLGARLSPGGHCATAEQAGVGVWQAAHAGTGSRGASTKTGRRECHLRAPPAASAGCADAGGRSGAAAIIGMAAAGVSDRGTRCIHRARPGTHSGADGAGAGGHVAAQRTHDGATGGALSVAVLLLVVSGSGSVSVAGARCLLAGGVGAAGDAGISSGHRRRRPARRQVIICIVAAAGGLSGAVGVDRQRPASLRHGRRAGHPAVCGAKAGGRRRSVSVLGAVA
eukprot:ctg_1019.g507